MRKAPVAGPAPGGVRRLRPRVWSRRLGKTPVAAALVLGAGLATTGTAAAVLTGAVGSSACAAVVPSPNPIPIIVTSAYPTAGLPAGGTQITITGSGFGNPGNQNIWAVFDFGYTLARQPDLVTVAAVVIDDSTIEIPSTPPEQNNSPFANVYLVGKDDVAQVTTLPYLQLPPPGAPNGWVPVTAFTYTNNPPPTTTTTSTTSTTTSTSITIPATQPVVNAVDPPNGTPLGGTPVSIVGTNLTGATSVTFGGLAATSFTVVNGGLIQAVAPPGSGATNVIVTTPAGTSTATPGSGFTFTTNLPAIKISPPRPKTGCGG